MKPISAILIGAMAIVVIIVLGGVAEKTAEAVAKTKEEEDTNLYNLGHGSYPQGLTPENFLPAPNLAIVSSGSSVSGQ